MGIKLKLKKMFCDHIGKIEKEEYLYTSYLAIDGRQLKVKEHYANHWVCIKCGSTWIEKIIREQAL